MTALQELNKILDEEALRIYGNFLKYLSSPEHLALFKEIPNGWEIKEKFSDGARI